MMTPGIILASSSKIRSELLQQAGVEATVTVADIDEVDLKRRFRTQHPGDIEGLARHLAEAKAVSVSSRKPDSFVIGADQLLVFDGRVLDKPLNIAEARAQLAALRSRKHDLITAVAVAQNGRPLWHDLSVATLLMRNFSDAFLHSYVERTGSELLTTLGGYRLEGPGVQLFEEIHGDYFSILGLPLLSLLSFLRKARCLPA